MAKYQGKSVTLNSPSRISKGQPGYGRKKSQVYVKGQSDKGGNIQHQCIRSKAELETNIDGSLSIKKLILK